MDITSDLMSKVKDTKFRALLTVTVSNAATNRLGSKSPVADHPEVECWCSFRSWRNVHTCIHPSSGPSWKDDWSQ